MNTSQKHDISRNVKKKNSKYIPSNVENWNVETFPLGILGVLVVKGKDKQKGKAWFPPR